LRGYEYHTGIVFAAYTPAYGRAVAQGGRFDDIGNVFGSSRPASGFDSELKVLARLSQASTERPMAISAPYDESDDLQLLIKKLRSEGERVIVDLVTEASDDARGLNCNRRIVYDGQQWQVKTLS
jgi:ATP phosphoribosyltransferase regulatory subunit